MRISALSEQCGVSVATIKFYIREGLVPPGVRRSATQADYADEHVRRIRLIRSLVDIGDLPLGTILEVLAAIDDESIPTHDVLGAVHSALAIGTTDPDETDLVEQIKEVTAYIDRLGWNVKPTSPAIAELARALSTLRELGWDVTTDSFEPYARAADDVAAWELAQLPVTRPRPDLVEAAVVGTVVFETILVAWRRLAEQHHSSQRS
jgi:DNA-binding transcriptional MerR regulator